MKKSNWTMSISTAMATAAMLACSAPDSTLYENEEGLVNVLEAEEVELRPVRAQLSIEDGALAILVENRASYDATIALNVTIDSPATHSNSDVGEIRLLAGEVRREVIGRDRIDGFDPADSSWLHSGGLGPARGRL